MKNTITYLLIYLVVLACFSRCDTQEKEVVKTQLFDLNWKFYYGNTNIPEDIKYNDQVWRNLDLPHDCNKDYGLLKSHTITRIPSGETKVVWYRKHFDIPESWNGKNIWIKFQGISNPYEIYINGKCLSVNHNTSEIFESDITSYLQSEGENVVLVKLSKNKQSNGIYSDSFGIYNHVWLVVKDSIQTNTWARIK
ncbi:hypothetical protein NO995_14940 [Aestuariibaculum sp. M13]|uniref:sugar-binding domain-containing protein n=1 Tax=Aestuariibaculum sp. M13 TaxID=2967132 RepID=UPI002159F7BF|nr:sugar-binding domain-containing protein [Aestuariibaculum sp. M13]MCR8668981.1 hypothetical protein [Aestuariibaculum sp. M13]